MNNLILYIIEYGQNQIQLQVGLNTVRLIQLGAVELFDANKQNISLHATNLLTDGELGVNLIVDMSLTTALVECCEPLAKGALHPAWVHLILYVTYKESSLPTEWNNFREIFGCLKFGAWMEMRQAGDRLATRRVANSKVAVHEAPTEDFLIVDKDRERGHDGR